MTSRLNQARRSGRDHFQKSWIQFHGLRHLLVRRAESLKESVRFRDDIKSQLVILEIPGRTGSPGAIFIVPGAPDTLEIIIAQPLDARGEIGGGFYREAGLVADLL